MSVRGEFIAALVIGVQITFVGLVAAVNGYDGIWISILGIIWNLVVIAVNSTDNDTQADEKDAKQ